MRKLKGERDMNTADIRARIEKTEETIAKKKALIEKRFKAIQKHISDMEKAVAGLGGHIDFIYSKDTTAIDIQTVVARQYIQNVGIKDGEWDSAWYSILWDYCYKIFDCTDSIRNARRDIADREKTLETYRTRLAEAEARENVFDSMPYCMKEFLDSVIESWDLWDKMKRESVKKDRETYWKLYDEYRTAVREHGNKSDEAKGINKEMREIQEKYTQFQWNELPYLDDEEVHELNVRAGRTLVTDLYDRVSAIVGTFEDADDLKVTRDNRGFAVINGTVTGNGRTAKVQSIGAGGWNIQRFHIRTLVHEVKA